jgi:hypothetical protein
LFEIAKKRARALDRPAQAGQRVHELAVVDIEPRPADDDVLAPRLARGLVGVAVRVDGRRDDGRLSGGARVLGEVGVAGDHAIGERDERRKLPAVRPALEDRVVEVEDRAATARGEPLEQRRGQLGHGSLEKDDVVVPQITQVAETGEGGERRIERARQVERPGEASVAVDARARHAHVTLDALGRERASDHEAARPCRWHALTLDEEDDPHRARRPRSLSRILKMKRRSSSPGLSASSAAG